MILVRVAIVVAAGVSSMAAQVVPKWEAVSIKPCTDNNGGGPQGPGRITFSCTSVNTLVRQAYLMMRQGPIYALTVAGTASGLQRTAAGSCALPTVDGPASTEMPGKAPLPPCAFPPRDASGFHGTTMKQFAAFLSQRTDRRVIDRTGLEGMFDIRIDWLDGNASSGPGAPTPPPPSNTDLEDGTAAIRGSLRKLGLKLEATQGPEEILVIDHVEKPSGN